MDDRNQDFKTILQRLGFEKITVGSQNIWKLASDDASKIIRAKVEISQRKEKYSLGKCSITLDCEKVMRQIESLAKKRFPRVTNTSSQTTESNSIQVIIELAPNRQRNEDGQRSGDDDPGSVLGWTTTITTANEALTLQVTDAFCLGTPLSDWWATIFGILRDGFLPGFDEYWTVQNIFEFSIPLWIVPASPAQLPDDPHERHLALAASNDLKIPQPLRITRDKNRVTLDLAQSEDIPEQDVPIEILEARETASLWRDIDQFIARKQKANVSLPISALSPHSVLARVAAMPDLAMKIAKSVRIDIEDFSAHSITSGTGATLILVNEGRSHDLVKLTSIILRSIDTKFGGLHRHAPLMNIAPELLGDQWSKVDAKLAFKSWKAAMLARGANPRILRKIAGLAQETNDFNLEFDTLIELCRIERRIAALKAATFRLIDLTEKTIQLTDSQTQELRGLLDVCARKSGFHHKIATALSKIQIRANEHRKALTILEFCLKSETNEASASDLSKMHATIANIWHQQEKNVSLASARYIAATTHPANPPPEIMDQAEAFFSAVGNSDQLKRLLLMRANHPAERSSWEAIERAAKQMSRLGQHADAIKAIVNLMHVNRYQQWYCDIITDGFNSEDVDWTQVTNAMQSVDPKQLPHDATAPWKLVAARCALKTNKNHSAALKTLCQKDVIPILDSKESSFIQKALITIADYTALSQFIETRLPYSTPTETKDLLDLVIDNNLRSLDGIFDQTIAAQYRTTEDINPLLRRQNKIFEAEDITGLEVLIKSVESTLEDSNKIIKILDTCIEKLIYSTNIKFEGIINQAIKSRQNHGEFTEVENAHILKSLIANKFINTATQLLKKSIADGQTGIEDADLIHNIFMDDPSTIAQWHFLMYEKKLSDLASHHHAKQHVHFALMSPIQPTELTKTILAVSKKDILPTSTLQIMESLCKDSKKLTEFLGTLVNQIEINTDESGDLVHWAIRLIHQNNMDRELAASLFRTWSQKTASRAVSNLLSEANLWLAANVLAEAQRAYLSTLSEPIVLDDPEICLMAIDGLAACKPAKTQLASVIQTLISWSESNPKSEITSRLIDKSIEHDVASSHHLHIMLASNFESSTVDKLATIAIQALTKAERTANGVSKLLTEWRESIGHASNKLKWKQLIECLTTDHLLRQLRRPARCEVLYQHAKNLIDDEQQRFDAIPHLEVIAVENPMDSRIWIPLYSLYEESDAKRKLITHLEKVIPLIERDASVLEKTPFNLESLKNTLKRTKKILLEREPDATSSSMTSNADRPRNFDLNDHAARLQRAWIDAIPVVKISAISGTPSTAAPNDDISNSSPDPKSDWHQASQNQGFNGSAAISLEPQQTEATPEFNAHFTKPDSQNGPDLAIVRSQTSNSVHQPLNWRDVITNVHLSPKATRRVMTMAFASELEKHIAVQSVALVGGETEALSDWHWPVWRDRQAFQYPMPTSGRLPKDTGLIDYGGPLHKLLKIITPILARRHRHKFIAKTHFAKRGLPSNTESRPAELSHPALARCALGLIESQLLKSKVRLLDTPGLGKDVFFDLSQRTLHFDGNWQLNLPPSILTYRLIEAFLHFQKGSLPIVTLHPETDIMPIINIIQEILSANGLARIRLAFDFEQRDIQSQIKSLNQEKLSSLIAWNKDKIGTDIKRLQEEIRFKALAETLATTLDLVGICEALNGENLCLNGRLGPGDFRSLDPLTSRLILLATKLNL